MRKVLSLGIAAGLMAFGAPVASANQSPHWTGTDCNYANTTANGGDQDNSVPVPGQQIYVYEGKGSTGNAGTIAVGACADVTPVGGFQGGDAEVGLGPSQGVIGLQDWQPVPNGPTLPTNTQQNGVPGVYAVIDGNDNNTAPPAGSPGASKGYAGVSNYEDGTPTAQDPKGQDPGCNGNDGDGELGSTNSGGCVGVKGVVNLPIPFIVCGNTSVPDWNGGNASGDRDGCFIP
jgi:hypothetical protein